ncbi:MAG: DUF4240 domain-containing protein [Stenomitos rutilans HA7619-LM2]|jgi:hypothetical protein|nr:DUF4240 domain-containing protein [Stenomitos rutilans HA7619-LM2]MBW4472628.1 DUF4240 domain-containing protein [Stenomitos rutilans HA7619-LM2]
MTEAQFWEIIERSKQGASDCRSQAQRLEASLCECTPEQIIAFDHLFLLKRLEAYRWDLWGVAHLLCGGCSNDGFEDFRRWLVGQGRQAFERALRDPESVVDLLERTGQMKPIKADSAVSVQGERLAYASCKAYESLAGEAMPEMDLEALAAFFPRQPLGEPWDEEDLSKLFPRVAKRFL